MSELLRLGPSRSLQVLYPISQLQILVLGGCKLQQAQIPAQLFEDSIIVTGSDIESLIQLSTADHLDVSADCRHS